MADNFDSFQTNLDSPFTGGQAVVGGTAFSQTCRALYVGTQGNLTITTKDGVDLTFVSYQGWLPARATVVKSAGLTASNIVAVW